VSKKRGYARRYNRWPIAEQRRQRSYQTHQDTPRDPKTEHAAAENEGGSTLGLDAIPVLTFTLEELVTGWLHGTLPGEPLRSDMRHRANEAPDLTVERSRRLYVRQVTCVGDHHEFCVRNLRAKILCDEKR
jgi:hypothetical protein